MSAAPCLATLPAMPDEPALAGPPALPAPDRGRHRLLVEADADPNVLLRLMEPFAIHDVMPAAMRLDTPATTLRAEIVFDAPAPLAERLRARIEAMVPVRRARLLARAAGEAPVDCAA